jgi:hypothetical protein
LLVTTELVIWCYANVFIFTSHQSELDFVIALVYISLGGKGLKCQETAKILTKIHGTIILQKYNCFVKLLLLLQHIHEERD